MRWGWILWAAGTAAFAILVIRAPAAQLPLLVTLGALVLLWPLWRLGRYLLRAMLASTHEPWQGRYYEFDGRQVRVLTDDRDALWFSADDVFDALGVQGSGRDPARVRLSAGREGLRPAPGTRLLCFTERGLSAWLERRTGRRTAAFDHWLRTQVIGPHRRRLEMTRPSERAQDPTTNPPTDLTTGGS